MKLFTTLILSAVHLFAFDAFVSPAELKSSLDDKNLIIIDVASKDIYKKSHITGAIHLDTASFIDEHSTYQQMNTPEVIQEHLRNAGINTNSKVLIYAHNTPQGLLKSSYFAFVLIAHGFENVSILDGGYMAWVFEYPLLSSTTTHSAEAEGNFSVIRNNTLSVDANYIQTQQTLTLLDARAPKEYYGIKKSLGIDVLGHIPMAQCAYYAYSFLQDSTLRNLNELNQIYLKGFALSADTDIVVYADTIFASSMTWYILYKKMGFKQTKIYEKSFKEWSDLKLPIKRFMWE